MGFNFDFSDMLAPDKILDELASLSHRRETCTICNKRFPHNSRTFGGPDLNGTVQLAGECCKSRITKISSKGIWLDNHERYADILSQRKNLPLALDIEPRIKDIRQSVADIDAGKISTEKKSKGNPKGLLIDAVWKESGEKRGNIASFTKRPMEDLRRALFSAKRFVLDDEMSAFLADLSNTPFLAKPKDRPHILNSMRHSSRLPHPIMWIEYNGAAFRNRLLEIAPEATDPFGQKLVPDNKEDNSIVPSRFGFLLEQHPVFPSAVSIYLFIEGYLGESHANGFDFHYVYNSADEPLPYADVDTLSGMFAHGVQGYHSEHFGLIFDRLPIPEGLKLDVDYSDVKTLKYLNLKPFTTHRIVVELTGTVRYILAFLSTLADMPVRAESVEPKGSQMVRESSGYRSRKFLNHSVIHLNVPARMSRQNLAKRLIASVRKRRHDVRGHWRIAASTANIAIAVRCDATHIWSAPDAEGHQKCTQCGLTRTWIPEHQRGDASLGFVSHSFKIQHKE